jgi:hypothetical protein
MMNLKNVVCLFLLFNIAMMLAIDPTSSNVLSTSSGNRVTNTFLNNAANATTTPAAAGKTTNATNTNNTHVAPINATHPANATTTPAAAGKTTNATNTNNTHVAPINATHPANGTKSSNATKIKNGTLPKSASLTKNVTHTAIGTHVSRPIKDIKKKPKHPVKPSVDKIPIVLILSCPSANGNTNDYYIPSDLAWWITVGGGVPVPFHYWSNDKDVDALLVKANGVIIQCIEPGVVDLKRGYEKFVDKLIKKVKALNDKKIYLPLFAIGGALETLITVESGNIKLSAKIEGITNLQTKLYFTASPIAKKFKLFTAFDRKDFKSFMRQPSNIIDTTTAIDLATFNKDKLAKLYTVTSYGKNAKKQKFVSSIEHTKYPIFGIFFHPERIIASRVVQQKLKYTQDAFSVSQRFLNQIIESGRQSPYTAKLEKLYQLSQGINVFTSQPTGIVNGASAWVYKDTNVASPSKKVASKSAPAPSKNSTTASKAPTKSFNQASPKGVGNTPASANHATTKGEKKN